MPTDAADIRDLNARAVRYSADLVSKATEEDLKRPTPCEGWTFSDLLAHMTAQHRGFAAAAAGNGHEPKRWALRPITNRDEAVADYVFTTDLVHASYSDQSLTRDFVLPEFGDDPEAPPKFPAKLAIGFHFIDYVVHGWDVARTLGVPFELDEDLAEPALAIAKQVPNGENRDADGAGFKPGTKGAIDDESLPALDRILLHLGRSPQWSGND